MNRYIFSLCLILFCTPQAHAAEQRVYKSGIQHTFVSRSQGDEAKTQENAKDPLTNEDTPQSKVWKKYRGLAAGEAQEETQEEELEEGQAHSAPAKPQKPQAPQQAQPKPTSGIAGIIEDYRRTKDQRREMKTIRLSAPEVPKPEVEKPEVEKPEKPEKSAEDKAED